MKRECNINSRPNAFSASLSVFMIHTHYNHSASCIVALSSQPLNEPFMKDVTKVVQFEPKHMLGIVIVLSTTQFSAKTILLALLLFFVFFLLSLLPSLPLVGCLSFRCSIFTHSYTASTLGWVRLWMFSLYLIFFFLSPFLILSSSVSLLLLLSFRLFFPSFIPGSSAVAVDACRAQ